MKPLMLGAALLSLLLLAGCKDQEAAAAARAAAEAQANEQAAAEAAGTFDKAVADGNWTLAKAQADVMIAKWPAAESTQRVREQYDEVKAKGNAESEARRTAALWAYQTENVKGGEQVSAAIFAKDEVDIDGAGAKPVRLIFRDHPDWGRSSYLVLQAGDFAKACYGKCSVTVTIDDAPPRKMAANRPKTDEAIAMFIDDEKALWRLTKDAKVMRIEFPTRDLGNRTAVFEVGGLDRARLPKWD